MCNALFAVMAVLALAGCRDESVAQYGAQGVTWQLVEIDKTPYEADATLRFDEKGKISGSAPCNSYSGKQTAPYPWFSVKDVAVTRRACPDLQAETLFFAALTDMTLSEVAGSTLILSTEAGREMVFKASNDP